MFEIAGKKGKAICFANAIEYEAISQIQAICNNPISENSNIIQKVRCSYHILP